MKKLLLAIKKEEDMEFRKQKSQHMREADSPGEQGGHHRMTAVYYTQRDICPYRNSVTPETD